MAPERKVSAAAQDILCWVPKQSRVEDSVRRERMAVGPSVTSLLVPNSMYIKHPMKAEYRPYCGCNCDERVFNSFPINLQKYYCTLVPEIGTPEK